MIVGIVDNHRDAPVIIITVGSFAHQGSTPSFSLPCLGPAHLSTISNLSSDMNQQRLVDQKHPTGLLPGSVLTAVTLLSWVNCWREMSSHPHTGGLRATGCSHQHRCGIPLSGQEVAVCTEGTSGSRVRQPPPFWRSPGATQSLDWLISST